MFINPQLSKQIKDERDAQNQQGIINNNNVKTTTEHTEVNPNNPNEITIYKDTNVDKDFDAKIQAVIGASDDKFTVLPDDVVKGNVAESKQDFIQKVIQNAQLEEQENKK
jgi:citrate lyase gamma subunit